MSKIYTITEPGTPLPEPTYNDPIECTSIQTIEIEKKTHEMKLRRRMDTFKNILISTPNLTITWNCLFYILSSVVIILISTFPFTLIPAHNVILYPRFWYEFPLQVLGYGPQLAADILLHCSYWMNIDYIRKYRHFLIMCMVGFAGMAILYPCGYIIWRYALHLQYPVPFNGYIYWYTILISFYVTLWFRFPINWCKNNAFRIRLRMFLVAILFNKTISVQYIGISKVLLTVQTQYQWIIAILLPLERELNVRIMTKLASKAACGDISAVQITSNFNISIRHSLFLAYVTGSFATTSSSVVILVMDIIINLGICFRIVWLKRRKPTNTRKIIELLQELAIAEMVEFVVPLVYLICFCIAYFGPNAKLIGNVGNDYWQYVKIKDVDHTITNICLFFFIDLLSAVS